MKQHPDRQRGGASTELSERVNDAWELGEFDPTGEGLERLMQEINILRLEGTLFCFNPKVAKKRSGKITIGFKNGRTVSVEPHPNYGQPSVTAYQVLQAMFAKITEEGYPYPDNVGFSQRELADLIGRTWSGRTSAELRDAILQLKTTLLHCNLYNKESDEWEEAVFNVVDTAWFSKKQNGTITKCAVAINPAIVKSINRNHVAVFNLRRLRSLDVIGMVIYKRLFFHFSNIYKGGVKARQNLSFHKDYEDMCREWLGGLKPERYISKIMEKHLGARLGALKRTGIIRRCDIEKRSDGSGFKLIFTPGNAFFNDYEAYYLDRSQPRFRFKQTAALVEIQRPLEAVAYFHKLLGHDQTDFLEKETTYAAHLLKDHSPAEVRDLIEYAVERAPETSFRMRWFGAVKEYRAAWRSDTDRRAARKRLQKAIDGCPHCDEKGMLLLKDRTGAMGVRQCPHDIEAINRFENENDLRRV